MVVVAEIPGVKKSDLDIQVKNNRIRISGRRTIDYEEGASLHRRERQVGSFRRAFELPALIDAEKVEAVHQNGILMLRLPKSPQDQPRQISVQAS